MTNAMARACHDGRKTVTRRPVSGPVLHRRPDDIGSGPLVDADGLNIRPIIPGAGTAKVGGRVWIRECWKPVMGPWRSHVEYRAGGRTLKVPDAQERFPKLGRFALRVPGVRPPDIHSEAWRPSIHMPKWACRTWGRIVSVRPERLQDITEEDARREGFKPQHPGGLVSLPPSCKAALVATWNDLYEARGLGWNANPWVWRIEWERIERPGDL